MEWSLADQVHGGYKDSGTDFKREKFDGALVDNFLFKKFLNSVFSFKKIYKRGIIPYGFCDKISFLHCLSRPPHLKIVQNELLHTHTYLSIFAQITGPKYDNSSDPVLRMVPLPYHNSIVELPLAAFSLQLLQLLVLSVLMLIVCHILTKF